MRRIPSLAILFASILAVPAPPAAKETESLSVVVSFSILGDMVRTLGGPRVAVHTLVGPDADAHVYEPVPSDARRVRGADLLVLNGLGFEGWLDRLVAASGYQGPLVQAAQGIDTLHDPSGHGADPHAWQSPRQARRYVGNLVAGLIAADSAGAETYRRAGDAYLARLDSLDGWIRSRLAGVPAARRLVITSHDAFGYLARDYDVRFLAPMGWSTDGQPSARTVAALIRRIRESRIGEVFLENIADPRLMDRIAREAGCRVGGRLYSDALSPPDGPAASYPALIQHNVSAILSAMTGAMETPAGPVRTGP